MLDEKPVFSAEVWMYAKSNPYDPPIPFILRNTFSSQEEMLEWIEKNRQLDMGGPETFQAYYREEDPKNPNNSWIKLNLK